MMNAEKAINHLIYLKFAHDLDAKHIINKDALDFAIKAIEQNPVKNGKWIDKTYGIGCDAECDQCHKRADGYFRDNGFGNDYYFYDFCPNCGADMREVKK